jgi:hypothetical protein
MEEPRVEPLEFRVNDDKVLVREHVTARGASSGIEIDAVSWFVWTLDADGLVKRVHQFLPHQEAEALEAAGLSN